MNWISNLAELKFWESIIGDAVVIAMLAGLLILYIIVCIQEHKDNKK